MINKQVQCAVADAIVLRLWTKGLLTTAEKDEILRKNQESFS